MAKRKPLLRVYRLSVHREGGADITEANVHAPDLREALTMAKQGLGAGAGFAIAPEDYPEATALGIPFNEADGMLLDPPAPPLMVWALYLSTASAGVNGISLYATRAEALTVAIGYLETDPDFTDGPGLRAMLTDDLDALHDEIGGWMDEQNNDWYIEECEVPSHG